MSRPTENELKEQYKIISRSKKNELRAYDALDLANWAIDKVLEISICTQRELDLESKIKQMQETIDNSIQIPDEKDWPKGALTIELMFLDATECYITTIQKISRSKPKYQPKVGDKVFWLDTRSIYSISGVINDSGIILSNNAHSYTDDIKPATLELMGKPWDDIPSY